MTKIINWLHDHKGWLKYWYIPFLIIGIVFVYKDCSNNDNEIIEALENGIHNREQIINQKLSEVETLKVERDNIIEQKQKVESEFEELKNREPKVITKIKTITINKTEYVPKKEYQILYDFSKELKEKFSLYIRLDKNSNWNIEKIITGFEKIIEEKDGIILDQEKIIKLKKKRKRIGLYFGFGYTQNKNFALNLSIGYRIL